MPNCTLYVLPNPNQGNRFDANGEYSFDLYYETADANFTYNTFRSNPIAFASSDQTIDNALKDDTIANALSNANIVLTRSDIRIFR